MIVGRIGVFRGGDMEGRERAPCDDDDDDDDDDDEGERAPAAAKPDWRERATARRLAEKTRQHKC